MLACRAKDELLDAESRKYDTQLESLEVWLIFPQLIVGNRYVSGIPQANTRRLILPERSIR